MTGKIKCPMCNGCGELEQPLFRQKLMQEKKQTALRMREQGYSIREIMTAMGYKSPRSFYQIINTK